MPIKQVKEYILSLFLLFTIILAVFYLLYHLSVWFCFLGKGIWVIHTGKAESFQMAIKNCGSFRNRFFCPVLPFANYPPFIAS